MRPRIPARAARHPLAHSIEASPTETQCVICLDAISEICELQPCRHRTFHFPCIDHWLRSDTRRSCPVCKTAVSRVAYGPVGDLQSYEYGAGEGEGEGGRRLRRRRRVEEPAGLAFRRHVYRRMRYSMHVGSNLRSGYRELCPRVFLSDVRLQCRARAFLRRELRVFGWLVTPEDEDAAAATAAPGEGPSSSRAVTVDRLVGHIVRLLCRFEIRGCDGVLRDHVARHLGQRNTSLLLHELHSFLRSPFESPQSWDLHVQYGR
ncbi:RING finger domain protein [Ophiocordyceps camponoti-floridani]|uniref:RING-type E3 ubiquitin transferase n=1 Tax=Ophiocordyceps camponoti-floridani TaxID=2030778 RepID=A0A8H4QCG2_9HYPO|nr:RING finger domain protein [Ophiocordyceps camponoti-floridani]